MAYHTQPGGHADDSDAKIQTGCRFRDTGARLCAAVRFKDGVELHAPPALSEVDQSVHAVECIEGRMAWEDHRQALHDSWDHLTVRTKTLKDACAVLEHMESMPLPTAESGALEFEGNDALLPVRAATVAGSVDLAVALAAAYDVREDLQGDRRAAAIWEEPIAIRWHFSMLEAALQLVKASNRIGEDIARLHGVADFSQAWKDLLAAVDAGDLEGAHEIWRTCDKPRLALAIPDEAVAAPEAWAWAKGAELLGVDPESHPLYGERLQL